MDDDRVWSMEEGLWRATEEAYRERVDPDCVMALGRAPHLFAGEAAVAAVRGTPAWDEVAFSGRSVSRPEEGLIVLGYRVRAEKGGTHFTAACTSVYRRRGHEDWAVVQHAQVPTEADGKGEA
jgi:hypothetical protein